MRRCAALLLLAAAAAAGPEVAETARPAFFVAEWLVRDVDGDGRDDLLLVGTHGEVRVWHADAESGALEAEPRGDLRLPEPRSTLFALADILGEGGPPQLVALTPDGALAYRVDDHGAFAAEPVVLARRARFRLRTNEPRLAPITQDINNDGQPDLVVPGREETEIWIHGAEGLRRAARIATDLDRTEWMAADRLSDELAESFRIPQLRTSDVNGDGRPDLIVRSGRTRAFHMQREDGSIPAEPDVKLDLEIFKDTTPRADIRPGRTWGAMDRTRYQTRDLDDDGIPDYVIAHRRKVWVFHGNRDKPQFVEPTTILKISDDVTMLLAVHLDDDRYSDLAIFKVQIPSVAGILAGLVSEMEIKIDALGYRNVDGRTFERTPAWRSTLSVRLPPLTKLLKDPGELLSRVEEVGRKFRPQRVADLTGDGKADLALLDENHTRFDFWFGSGAAAKDSLTVDFDATLRRMVFGDENKVWDIDRMLDFVAGFAQRRTAGLTGGRDPDASLTLRDPQHYALLDFELADLDGDGAKELLIEYGPLDTSTPPLIDVIRLAP